MSLKIETTIVHKVNYSELERFIKNEYGIEYEIPSNEEANNDSTISVNTTKGELNEYEKEQLQEWLDGEEVGYIIGVILSDLVNKNKVPEGYYNIRVSW